MMEFTPCRICYDPTGELIRSCHCKGSVGVVHRECLDQWRFSGWSGEALTHCELCKFEYQLEPCPVKLTRSQQVWIMLQVVSWAVSVLVVHVVVSAVAGMCVFAVRKDVPTPGEFAWVGFVVGTGVLGLATTFLVLYFPDFVLYRTGRVGLPGWHPAMLCENMAVNVLTVTGYFVSLAVVVYCMYCLVFIDGLRGKWAVARARIQLCDRRVVDLGSV